jgi:hypothetical protein
LVIGGSSNQVGVSQPDPTGESSMTIAKPPARYGAISGALANGFATPSYTTTRGTTYTPHNKRFNLILMALLFRGLTMRPIMHPNLFDTSSMVALV